VGNDYLAEQGKILSVREMPWSLSICDDVTQMIIEDVNQLIVDNRSLVNSAYTTCKLLEKELRGWCKRTEYIQIFDVILEFPA